MKPMDELYRDLADRAHEQAEALGNQFSAIIDGEDDDGEACDMWMAGIDKDRDGRALVIFYDPDVPNGRVSIRVDAILELASLIRRERVVEARG